MWMSDARVICAVWGCAHCLSVCLCVCVSVWPLGVFRERAWPLCVLQCRLHSRPSVLLLF